MSEMQPSASEATPVQGVPLTQEQLLALALSGAINVTITLEDGTVYTLDVQVPTGANSPYTLALTKTPAGTGPQTPQKLADFSYTDSNDFSFQVLLPTINLSDKTKISGGFTLKNGSALGNGSAIESGSSAQ